MAETIYGYLYDRKSDYILKDIYVARTLALINQIIIMDSYEKINQQRIFQEEIILDWQTLILLLSLTGILILYNRKK